MSQKIIGSTLLVAGTTIGAGMLALPMTSAQLGFANSIILLVCLWIYMVIAALVMVEISQGKGNSIALIVKKKLGPWAQHLAALSLLVLFWSLLSAYISGASSILRKEIGGGYSWIAIGYTCLLGICVAACTKAVDYTNRILFILKCMIFLAIILGLFPFIQSSHLQAPKAGVILALSQAIPIFFTSFGFHGSVPSLIKYLQGDKRAIYFSIIVGSLIPLIVYILWQTVTLGVIGDKFDVGGDVGAFIALLTQKTDRPHLRILTDLFAFFAVATSFLGVALGLFDYIAEWFAKEEKKQKTKIDKTKVALVTFMLPLVFSLFYPEGFVFALGFASIALSLLAIVLPSLVAMRDKHFSGVIKKGIALCMLLGGVGIIILEVVNKLS